MKKKLRKENFVIVCASIYLLTRIERQRREFVHISEAFAVDQDFVQNK